MGEPLDALQGQTRDLKLEVHVVALEEAVDSHLIPAMM